MGQTWLRTSGSVILTSSEFDPKTEVVDIMKEDIKY